MKITELVDEGGGNIVEKVKYHTHFVPNFLMVAKPPKRRGGVTQNEGENVKKAKDKYGVGGAFDEGPKAEVHLLSGYAGKDEREDEEEARLEEIAKHLEFQQKVAEDPGGMMGDEFGKAVKSELEVRTMEAKLKGFQKRRMDRLKEKQHEAHLN